MTLSKELLLKFIKRTKPLSSNGDCSWSKNQSAIYLVEILDNGDFVYKSWLGNLHTLKSNWNDDNWIECSKPDIWVPDGTLICPTLAL